MLQIQEKKQSKAGQKCPIMKTQHDFTLTLMVKLGVTFLVNLKISNSSLDPLILHGEGSYNLNVVKDMKVTDSFMGLSQSAKQCQNKDAYLDCKTDEYLDALVNTCECLPFGLKYFNDTKISICNSTQMKCAQEAKNLVSKCLIRCEGLVVTSYSHQKSNVLDKMMNIIESYKKFKAIIDLPSKQNFKTSFYEFIIYLIRHSMELGSAEICEDLF